MRFRLIRAVSTRLAHQSYIDLDSVPNRVGASRLALPLAMRARTGDKGVPHPLHIRYMWPTVKRMQFSADRPLARG